MLSGVPTLIANCATGRAAKMASDDFEFDDLDFAVDEDYSMFLKGLEGNSALRSPCCRPPSIGTFRLPACRRDWSVRPSLLVSHAAPSHWIVFPPFPLSVPLALRLR